MAKYGSDQVNIKFTTASATSLTLHDLGQYIDTFNGVKIEALTQEGHGFGDSWVEHLYTGIRRMDPVTVAGFYDNIAASGPNVMFGNASDIGSERRCEVNFAGTASNILQFAGLVMSYSRLPTRSELTRFELVFQPSGAVNTATNLVV